MPQKEVLYFTPAVQYKIQLTFVAGIRFFLLNFVVFFIILFKKGVLFYMLEMKKFFHVRI